MTECDGEVAAAATATLNGEPTGDADA